MRRLVSLVSAVLLLISLPMTVLADGIVADIGKGDATIYDTTADYTDGDGNAYTGAPHNGQVTIVDSSNGSTNNTVKVEMDGQAESNDATADSSAPVPEKVVITGDVNGGVEVSGGATVEITGDVSNSAANSAAIEVNYDANADGTEDEKTSTVIVDGSVTGKKDGVDAGSGAVVLVSGSVTGENGFGVNANGAEVTVGNGVSGGWCGVAALGDSKVTVTGDVEGSDDPDEWGGTGVWVGDNSTVYIDGNVTGGTGDQYDGSGAGLVVDATAKVTVTGNVTGGGTDNEADNDSYGLIIERTEDTVDEAGYVTIHGDVSGGGSESDIYIRVDANGNTKLPEITICGNFDTLVCTGPGGSKLTEEELQAIRDSISREVRQEEPSEDRNSANAEPDRREEAPTQSGYSRSGYSKGALWQNGYISRTLFKVENGAGMKPEWTETMADGILTITAEKEPLVFTTWLNGLKYLQEEMEITTIVLKTADCETTLKTAELIAMNGSEYILTQEGENALLTVDGTVVGMEA